MPLKFAIIGETGQLAKALAREIPIAGHSGLFLNRVDLDLSSNSDAIEKKILSLPDDIDGVILAAAYTAVDKAETERDLAFAVNAAAPGAIARSCKTRGLPLIHISTDYVFKGNAETPYLPEAPTDPINSYGASKLAGELEIIESGCIAAILRTSWVFDGTGTNFMNTMLRLAQTRDALTVVGDQIGRPTYAGHLAQAAIVAAEELCTGKRPDTSIFHVSGTGEPTSWAGFANAIFDAVADKLVHTVTVTPVPTSEYPTPAARPAYSVMNVTLFEKSFGYKIPKWQDGLNAALIEKFV